MPAGWSELERRINQTGTKKSDLDYIRAVETARGEAGTGENHQSYGQDQSVLTEAWLLADKEGHARQSVGGLELHLMPAIATMK